MKTEVEQVEDVTVLNFSRKLSIWPFCDFIVGVGSSTPKVMILPDYRFLRFFAGT